MSQIANIIVYDGTATPVQHTLTPVSVTREKGKVIAEWRETSSTVPLNAQIRVSMTIERLKSGVYKTEQRVAVPVMEATSGPNAAGYTAAPKVAYEDTVVTTGWFHERSTVSGRRRVRQLATNLQNDTSASVVASTSGFFPELIDTLVAPT